MFTDLEGSTELWDLQPDAMSEALRLHDALLDAEITGHGGAVFKRTGDGVGAVFAAASNALDAASSIHLGLRGQRWIEEGLRVRIGINTGEAEPRLNDYFGSAVNLTARVTGVARGQQTLVGESTALIARGLLRKELELRDLGEYWLRGFHHPHRLFQLSHPDLPSDFPPIPRNSGLGSVPPTTPTVFVGRRRDLVEIVDRIASHRLVSLIGPGGVGKSRLAEELARRVQFHFPDGVWWSALGPVGDPGLVAHSVASSLGVAVTTTSAIDAITDDLRTRRLLLVLDNCEHQLETVREVATAILMTCPAVAVLVTSREALRIPGEHVHVIEPLGSVEPGTADGEDEALELFLDRARSAGARFDNSPSGLVRLAAVCRRLDGLPLALELAAARMRSMTIDELERRLGARFSLLGSTRHPDASLEARHATMQRAVDWSYEALSPTEQRLFERVGVFRGGFELDAAEAVCPGDGLDVAAIPDLLFELVEKSLVIPDTTGATTRYRQLETLSEFATARLTERGEAESWVRAHALHYRDFAEHAEEARSGAFERKWVEAQLRELDNMRAALACVVATGDVDTALRTYVALYELALFQGTVEVFDWLEPARYLDTGHELTAAALAMSGLRHDPLNPASLETSLQALDLHAKGKMRNHRILSFARGFAEASRGNVDAALVAFQQSADVILDLEGRNGRWIAARALVITTTRDRHDAEQLVRDAGRVAQPTGIALALLALARAMSHDDPAASLSTLAEASEHAASVYNRQVQVYIDLSAATIVEKVAGPDAALRYHKQALVNALQLRQHEVVWRSLTTIGGVLRRCGQTKLADELLQPWIDASSSLQARGSTELHWSPSPVEEPAGRAARMFSVDELVQHTLEVIGRAEATV
jgi:predicted ATPase/class 3 adenylate cyclase